MYLPKHFASDTAAALALIHAHPFASFITVHAGQVYATQIPIIVAAHRHDTVLIGHMAGANPHAAALLASAASGEAVQATVLFTGDNAYISPTAQAQGAVTLMHDAPSTEAVVKSLIERFDAQADAVKQAWADSPAAAQAAQLGAILAFEIHVTSLQAKLKLSQNRSAQDQANVAAALTAQGGESAAVAARMRSTQNHQD
jgi:transcriptional regulator